MHKDTNQENLLLAIFSSITISTDFAPILLLNIVEV